MTYRLRLSRAGLKIRVSTRIPAQLVGGTGVTITKANGVYTFDMDETEIADVATGAALAAIGIGANTQAYDADLDAVAALSGTGIARRTGSNAWSVGTAVANSELAAMAAYTVKANNTNGSATPTDVLITDIAPLVLPQGRLTLQTAVPVMITTQSAKTTIHYTAYHGNRIPIYDGTRFILTTITGGEISVATNDTTKSPAAIGASKVNDWFVWNDSGTIRLGHGPDWTNDTTRSAGTALVMVNGILLNNASITNGPAASRGTYVGTTRSNSSSQLDWIIGGSASGGTAGFLGVWNAYNRVQVTAQAIDTGSSYTYSSATIRQARASAGNQVSAVFGLAEDAIDIRYSARTSLVASSAAVFGIGVDSTSTFFVQGATIGGASGTGMGGTNSATSRPLLGLHVFSANEQSDGANANNFDVASLNAFSVTVRM